MSLLLLLVGAIAATVASQASPLQGTGWVLATLPGHRVLGTGATLRFEAERASGSDGCNRFTATYTSGGSSLQFGPRTAATQMACPDPVAAQAMVFMNALSKTRHYRVEAGQLQLLGEDGQMLAGLAPQPVTLAGSAWMVTGVNNGRQAVASVLQGTRLTLSFGADGRFSGTAGCNSFTGPYTSDGSALRLGPAAATRKMCAEPGVMDQERQLLAALATVATARIEGERLELRTADGALAISATRETGK